MCGRYVLQTEFRVLAALYGLGPLEDSVFPSAALRPRFNIAPSQIIPIIRQDASGARTLNATRWGLVPFWAKDPTRIGGPGGPPPINARSESVATKPAFREAFRSRRVLVPIDAFYEWKAITPDGKLKQPYAIHRPDRSNFVMAAIWDRWIDPEKSDAPPLDTCAILTCPANAFMREIHDRMPVILPSGAWARWLDPAISEPAELLPMLIPLPEGELASTPVSTRVNAPGNDDPTLLDPCVVGADNIPSRSSRTAKADAQGPTLWG